MAARNANIVPLKEVDIVVTDAEIEEYAEWLGIDLDYERDLLWVAREGLLAKLPAGWQACKDLNGPDDVFYWNSADGTTTWEHPNEPVNKDKVRAERDKRRCVMATLTLRWEAGEMSVVATSLGGSQMACVDAMPSTNFGDVEDGLRQLIAVEQGEVLCFVKPDASLIGFSDRAKALQSVLR